METTTKNLHVMKENKCTNLLGGDIVVFNCLWGISKYARDGADCQV